MADNLRGIPFSTPDEGVQHTLKAKNLVMAHMRNKGYVDDSSFSFDDIYIVMFSYILGNWKALVSTTLPDGRYYEVTYRAANKQAYLDEYIKVDNVVIPDGAN